MLISGGGVGGLGRYRRKRTVKLLRLWMFLHLFVLVLRAIMFHHGVDEVRHIASNLDQIANGMQIIARALPAHSANIKMIEAAMRRITTQLQKHVEHVVGNQFGSHEQATSNGLAVLMSVLNELNDLVYEFFAESRYLDVDALW